MCKVDWLLVSQVVAAFGTLSVAILAIWGGYFKSIFTPPKLKIIEQNLDGEKTILRKGPRGAISNAVIFYHLKVVNNRTWSIAKNCKVLLTEVLIRGIADQEFHRIPLNTTLSFRWTPSEHTGLMVDISHEHIFDFGYLEKDSLAFAPILSSYPNNFPGSVFPNTTVRYVLHITAEGYRSKRPQVFEVYWNGDWEDNMDDMRKNISIKEIN